MSSAPAFDFDRQGNLVASPPRQSHQPTSQIRRRPHPPETSEIRLERSRDDKLNAFGKAMLGDRYLLPGEGIQDMFARVSCAFADNAAHAQRLYDAMSKLWFMPATPILSNGGTQRGLPISCFLNTVPDSLEGIVAIWNENVDLASNGGGIGTYWGGVRSIGEAVKGNGATSGIIPFIRVMDSLTLAISQGSLRRGSAAVYLDIHHPEIEEFLEIRKASGDFNRKSLNLHHAINITDDFMEAVRDDRQFALKSPKSGEVLRSVGARQLWQKILETRLQTGEPYLLFTDTVNRALPKHQRDLGLRVSSSNLCAEITLPTGRDHRGQERTAVCCLSSLNIETWDEWENAPGFIEDVLRFLDNVLSHFIETAPDGMERAAYAAMRERSVGLGVMGFHSFLQARGIPFESALAKSWNLRLFRKIRRDADAASVDLADERGACPDAAERGMKARFSAKLAIAPTASISIICGGTSACVEPIPANVYTHKTLSGSFSVRNPHLARRLADKGLDTAETWQSIIEHEGSVQHLEGLSDDEKLVFRTAFEIDQRWIIDLAADRAPFICQSQSINLYLPADADKWDLHMLHWTAWRRGLKSLYYCRSKSVQRAAFVGREKPSGETSSAPRADYDECLACQ
ncbi:ribonucleoside-diphosphate reductase subunit alpha [Rhodospirillum rubrum]|uniref:Ribonucleoside-diphosphate reductase n=1 Tax=Rhodospirillum rubrum (strain ATCC 11170 / ATH 1.1.1 / DSM 467 / LMG 4362 / NCIMB 8255 / S1) TaxID=269796 RepID=Q2RUF0_RHORT|nr:ribonucleoside-diphosphate reductase subunit alpha [Rhodospirillum rubrum]ABC22245.1 Ribonucleoside-diphosphate reductase [Rhodospirillum rubrum ATCC 11170]AEO47962.1 ribonucleotide-diphosphate reductase subunit alpha [Rhodospirillum rubrum F11]MBK5953811.1 ribonucleotide-diphosphate reductase subunit alpha [Rhodospirillum rubrum]QXG81889.1 ribonucleoside-diphosphate reductase subunit alpha [Rhodospirillum rubrum]HAP99373.1 ribonucleoside-diphosphate reductase subunit alpha [Rhodospirillum 